MTSYGLVCVNCHAMDDGYIECPTCGEYRPPGCIRKGMTSLEQQTAIRTARHKMKHLNKSHAAAYACNALDDLRLLDRYRSSLL